MPGNIDGGIKNRLLAFLDKDAYIHWPGPKRRRRGKDSQQKAINRLARDDGPSVAVAARVR